MSTRKKGRTTYWVKYVWWKNESDATPHSKHLMYYERIWEAKDDQTALRQAKKIFKEVKALQPDRDYELLAVEKREAVTTVTEVK